MRFFVFAFSPVDAVRLYREARQGMSNSDFNNVTLLLPAGSGLTQAAEEINGEWQKQFSLFFSLEEVEPEEFLYPGSAGGGRAVQDAAGEERKERALIF